MNGPTHRGAARVELFDRQEQEYLDWLQQHSKGYVANTDRAGVMAGYPMIHRASHGLMSSDRIGNFTISDYVKYCSDDLDALSSWMEFVFGKSPTRCKQCL